MARLYTAEDLARWEREYRVHEVKRRTPKIPTDADFGKEVARLRGRINQIGSRLRRGVLTPEEYFQSLFDLLEGGHAQAVFLGRRLAGDLAPLEDDDFAFAQMVMNEEAYFLGRFKQDVLLGRYTDEEGDFKIAQINARARQYAGKLRGTANEGFVLASQDDDTFAWHDLTAESCEECPTIAAGGPYTAAQLRAIGYPGQGRQPCRTNCGCVIVRLRDKKFGFTRSYD